MKQVDLTDFHWQIQLKTQGDAVNYDKKNLLIDLDLDESYLGLKHENMMIQVFEDGLLYNGTVNGFPTIHSNVFDKNLYSHLSDLWFNQKILQKIYERNMHQTFKLLEPFASHDANQIDIVFTLNDLYSLSEAYVEMISKEPDIHVFDLCIQEHILKDYDIKTVFEAYFKQLLDKTALEYHMDSPIQLHFYTKKDVITGFLFNIEMKYLNCDAFERIVITGKQ
ncbi:MAG: hypothetical protein JXR88_11645 [Clostridia bacterium]|nr:hypothetical protein [Clostridia bacterium]